MWGFVPGLPLSDCDENITPPVPQGGGSLQFGDQGLWSALRSADKIVTKAAKHYYCYCNYQSFRKENMFFPGSHCDRTKNITALARA